MIGDDKPNTKLGSLVSHHTLNPTENHSWSSLPSSDTPLDSPILVNETQVAQVPQPTLGIPRKGKIKKYSGLKSTPNGKALKLIPANNT